MKDFLALAGQFVSLLIPIVLPIILAVLGVEVRKLLASSTRLYDSQVSIENRSLIASVVRTAVQAAEQAGLVNKAGILGEQKKAIALDFAQSWLREHNIPVDVSLLEGQIESAVYNEFNKKPPQPGPPRVVAVPIDVHPIQTRPP